MITLSQYWMGRDREFPTAMTPDIEHNARITVELVNKLLERLLAAGVHVHISPITGSQLASGWRPATLNAKTVGAAPNSKHITAQAADIYDPEGEVDDWLTTKDGLDYLGIAGLWLEHPSATKGWAHVQTIPPRSGKRVFYP
jgi:hypothetical protein